MGRPKKYLTEEERKAAKREAVKRYQERHPEKVDFFDFVSATVSELSKIVNNGKKEFDFENKSEYNDKEMKRWYYNVDGVAIQKHNKTLAEYTLDLIDYMYVCIKLSDNGVVAFEKYIEEN